MEILNKLFEPSVNRKPFFKTGELKKDLEFSCEDCGAKIKIESKRQILNHWNYKTDSVIENESEFLKKYYNIGLTNKSNDGGFPVFDKVKCKKCESEYFSYCGVREVSNSNFWIVLNGLIQSKSSNLSKALRNNLISTLELLSSFIEQIDYAENVGEYIAIQEMACMWFDDHYHPDSENFIKGFSNSELDYLKAFNEYYDSIVDNLPENELKVLHSDSNWKKLSIEAKKLVVILKNAT